jgi:hypothetical protein
MNAYAQTRKALRFSMLASLLSFGARAAPISYDLAVAARTTDVISGKTLTGFDLPSLGANPPAIGNGGRVAFYATYSEGPLVGEGIFTPASLVLKTGDVINGRTLDEIGFVPALNDSGLVVVHGLLHSQTFAILTSGTLLAGGGNTIGGQTLTDFLMPAIIEICIKNAIVNAKKGGALTA